MQTLLIAEMSWEVFSQLFYILVSNLMANLKFVIHVLLERFIVVNLKK